MGRLPNSGDGRGRTSRIESEWCGAPHSTLTFSRKTRLARAVVPRQASVPANGGLRWNRFLRTHQSYNRFLPEMPTRRSSFGTGECDGGTGRSTWSRFRRQSQARLASRRRPSQTLYFYEATRWTSPRNPCLCEVTDVHADKPIGARDGQARGPPTDDRGPYGPRTGGSTSRNTGAGPHASDR